MDKISPLEPTYFSKASHKYDIVYDRDWYIGSFVPNDLQRPPFCGIDKHWRKNAQKNNRQFAQLAITDSDAEVIGSKVHLNSARAGQSFHRIPCCPSKGMQGDCLERLKEPVEGQQLRAKRLCKNPGFTLAATLLRDSFRVLEKALAQMTIGKPDYIMLLQKWNAQPIAKGQNTALKSRPAKQKADEEVLIELRDVWKTFGDKAVLQGANIKIRRGEAVGIIGGSGTGKSTTLRLMAGLLMPDQVELLSSPDLDCILASLRSGSYMKGISSRLPCL